MSGPGLIAIGPWKIHPWALGVIGALLAIITVQAVMVTIATRNPPVLESRQAYEDGLAHEGELKAWRAARALGWAAQVDADTETLTLRLTAPNGAPITGLTGELTLSRADTAAHDATLKLAEAAPGIYQTPRPPGPTGSYRLRAQVEGGPTPWLDERTVWLP